MITVLCTRAVFAAAPEIREPDAVLGPVCASSSVTSGWVDMDHDGVLDFVTGTSESRPFLQIWPSSVPWAEPTRLWVGGVQDQLSNLMIDPVSGFLAAVVGPEDGPRDLVELAVDPETWFPVIRWREPEDVQPTGYIGDIDGDGLPDLSLNSDARLSSTGARVPMPPRSLDGRDALYTHPVGDLNGDGFDDLIVAYREEIQLLGGGYVEPEGLYGPAALFMGSPLGFSAEPLWVLEDPVLAVGGSVVRPGDEDTLVITLVEEEFRGGGEYAEMSVLYRAGTANPTLGERVVLTQENPHTYPDGWTPPYDSRRDWHLGMYSEPSGEPSVIVVSSGSGPHGIQWHRWDLTERRLEGVPLAVSPYFLRDSPWVQPTTAQVPAPQAVILIDAMYFFGWAPPVDPGPVPSPRPEDCEWPREVPQLPAPSTGGDEGWFDGHVPRTCGCDAGPTPSGAGLAVLGALALVRRLRREGPAARR